MTALTMSLDHNIYYSNKDKVPIKDVVKGLLAAEKLFNELKPSIIAVFPDANITEVNIYLDKIETGSIFEDFIIDVVCGGEDGYEKLREKLRTFRNSIVGHDDEDGEEDIMKQILTVMIASMLVAGITYAIVAEDEKLPQPINNYNTTITNIVVGDGKGALKGSEIVDIVKANSDKRELAAAAVDFVSPAKEDPNATISINNLDAVTIPTDVIKATPKKYTKPIQKEKTKNYSNTPVFVVASDANKRRVGWSGKITGIVDKRIKLIIADDINPDDLHGHRNISADISVISKYNEDKKQYEEKEVLIKAWSPRK